MDEINESHFREIFTKNFTEKELEVEIEKYIEIRKAKELWEAVCLYENELVQYFANLYEKEKNQKLFGK